MKKVLRVAAVSAMALSFTTGIAAASTGSIGTTGPDSTNKVEFSHREIRRVENNNTVGVSNDNPQDSYTGRARVSHNTTGGNARSGDATNDSLQRTTIRLNNAGSSSGAMAGLGGSNHSGTINNTGPDSYNKVEFKSSNYVNVSNNYTVSVSNSNTQNASSGRATVSGNTTGGSATSGDATNVSTMETTIEVTN